jgi:hypothetical protein
MDIPWRARAPMQVPIRLAEGVLIESACGDDDLAAAASGVRQRRATPPAKRGGKAARCGKVEARNMFRSNKPPKGAGLDHRIGCVSRARCFSASRTVAVDEAEKRQGNFKAHITAQAAATYLHDDPRLSGSRNPQPVGRMVVERLDDTEAPNCSERHCCRGRQPSVAPAGRTLFRQLPEHRPHTRRASSASLALRPSGASLGLCARSSASRSGRAG